ncbi:cyclin domain-containing protein [Xylaria palmicola]|nr:cyclin domain-containing protein [Xylaria palmicola]
MAASYWDSTQRHHWLFSKEELAQMREKMEENEQGIVQMFPLPQRRHLSIYFNQQLNRLGKRLGVRQQALATAQIYLKRFYCKVEIRRTNPYLVIATALYLACKMEECPQHIRLVVSEARALWPVDVLLLDISRLGECEFFMISEMHSHLIIHQPYRTLTSLQGDFFMSPEETNLALSIVNDHYMTDLPLLYPPHIIALTAILLGLVLRPNSPAGAATNLGSNIASATAVLLQSPSYSPHRNPLGGPPGVSAQERHQEARLTKLQRYAAFLTESTVDIEGMIDCTQELISFYECHELYNDKITREQINRFVKARSLDKN